MTKSELKFALIGCGKIAHRYANLLKDGISDAKFVSVCDVNLEKAQTFAKSFDVPAYSDAVTMIQKENINVACVLTPSGWHAQNTIEIASHCQHIVVEKPMALTLQDADEMIERCDKAGTKLYVVKQNRFNVPVVHLKKAIDEGRFGKLVMGTVRVRWCRKQDYYDQDAWRGTWALDGGVLANQASHHIDLLQWLLGDVKSVKTKGKHFLVDIEAEDTAIALLEFQNGALGVIEATTAARPCDTEGSLSVLGEKGLVEIEGFAVNKLKTWQFDQIRPEDKTILEQENKNPPDPYGYGHRKYLENLVHSILTGDAAKVNGHDGRKSVKLLEALYESMSLGKEVLLEQGQFPFSPLGKNKV